MSLVIPPGFGNAAFIFTGSAGTQPFVTTLGVEIESFGGDHVAAANFAKQVYAANMASITSNNLVLDRVTLAIGNDGPGGSVDSDTAPVPMTASVSAGVTAMSVIARKVTDQFGRFGRGRMFLPGVNSEAGIEPDGSLTTAYRNQVQTALGNLFAGLGAGSAPNLPPVLLHGPAISIPPTPMTGLVVSDTVGWIRGRIR